MTKLSKYLFLIALILSIAIYIVTHLYFTERKERKRVEQNQNEFLAQNEVLKLELKKQELKAFIANDSFLFYKLKKERLSAKQINDLLKSNVQIKYVYDVILKDTFIYLPGDTIEVPAQYSFYTDSFATFYNYMYNDTNHAIYNVSDDLYVLDAWKRKRILWLPIGRRIDNWSMINKNPNASYNIEYTVKKVK